MVEHLFIISTTLFASGSLFALCFYKWQKLGNTISLILAAIASCFNIVIAASVLLNQSAIRFNFPLHHAIIEYNFFIDSLSAIFILVISVISFIASIYSLGYTKLYVNKRDTRFLGFNFNFFLLSMILVITANNALVFMIVWELMTLVSFFLVIFEYENPLHRKAGFVYLFMSYICAIFISVAFFIMFSYVNIWTFDFDSFRYAGDIMPAISKNIVFFLVLIGFGIKAGIFPLHLWLPLAHPAAPGNVSMVMSGVMIKTAIYGFIRFYFEFLTPCPPWWGIIVLTIGATSAILGILYALMEKDIKTLLAYSSVENIGIILISIGLSMIFKSYNLTALSSLALVAGLYHMLNHAVFKSLLFGCAGNIYYSTHTKNIEQLGGLIKRLQITAPLFLVGALAISAIPPLNGFMSEWLVFQSLLNGFDIPSVIVKVLTAICGATVALTGALVATCFVKAFGISFLALPRSEHAQHAKEVPVIMYVSMGLLAGLCVLMGLFPAKIMMVINHVNIDLLDVNIARAIISYDWLQTDTLQTNFSVVSTKSASVFGLMLLAITVGAMTLINLSFTKKLYETWTCGISPEPRFGYTATAFTKPFRIIFSNLYRPRLEIKTTYSVFRYFVKSILYVSEITPIFEKYFYAPLSRYVLGISNKVRWIHIGSVHIYLIYIFITLLISLLVIRW
ncbi:MAG: proton-conducting transporter transmembrane domain-containing protein [Candidatus Loosdrechtia sp.]|uniref:proton-conducting transporter transmembrane domain-containing protein n=1 Tax=Candidatus Loosdrechtia sp. TaxID=3101272 RepID=UPI003A7051AC|nr:MAG: proton-conducting transporter membrane subunit [Candidatus Jettenia sp. AMX2]